MENQILHHSSPALGLGWGIAINLTLHSTRVGGC